MAAEHPTASLLEQFMRGDLAGFERRFVIRHLIAGCDRCREVTRRLWALGNEEVLPQARIVAARARQRFGSDLGEGSGDRALALIQQRHEMLRAGLGAEAARVAFELALLYRREDRGEDLAALAGDVVPILCAGDVSRTVAAALLVFRRLAETDSASEEFLREAVRLASPATGDHTAGDASPR